MKPTPYPLREIHQACIGVPNKPCGREFVKASPNHERCPRCRLLWRRIQDRNAYLKKCS